MRLKATLRELKVVAMAEAQMEVWFWWALGPTTPVYHAQGQLESTNDVEGRGMVIFPFAKANSGARMRKGLGYHKKSMAEI